MTYQLCLRQNFENLTQGELSAESLLRYFAPLEEWLDSQLDSEEIGWDPESTWTPAGFNNFPEEAKPSPTSTESTTKSSKNHIHKFFREEV